MNKLRKNKENFLKMPACVMNLKLSNMMLMMDKIIIIIRMGMIIIMINTTSKLIIMGMIK